MNYEKFNPHYHKPSKFTGEAYGVKTSVEHDHSDLDIDQLMDAFQTIAIGLGYHTESWKRWILDRADEYREEDGETKEPYTYEDFKRDEEEFENDFFGSCEDYKGQFEDWKTETPDDRYAATEEDESEFDDYGMRIPEDRVTFEWGDEEEDDDLEFDEPNEELSVNDYTAYKKALKTLLAKQKKKSK
jgi:hypothetical protein